MLAAASDISILARTSHSFIHAPVDGRGFAFTKGGLGGVGTLLNPKNIWQAVLGELQVGISRPNFDTWFKGTSIVSVEDDVFIIGVPNAFAREWLENKYRQNVKQALQRAIGRTVVVRFVTANATVRAAAGATMPSVPAPDPG